MVLMLQDQGGGGSGDRPYPLLVHFPVGTVVVTETSLWNRTHSPVAFPQPPPLFIFFPAARVMFKNVLVHAFPSHLQQTPKCPRASP